MPRVINKEEYCLECGGQERNGRANHFSWCMKFGESLFTCSVCGLNNGSHFAECIASIIKANTNSLTKLVNRCYSELLILKRTKLINWTELDALCEHIARETGILRALNESVKESHEAPPEDKGEGCS